MAQPNLLFLFTDEQRADTMAAYGNEKIEAPNLNRLSEHSTVFERAYVTQPVCTPSRSTILTGLYPHTNGCVANNIPLREETPCLPELLTRNDYACAYHGKWHLGDEIFCQHGFDEWVSIEDGYRGYYSEGRPADARSSYHQWLTANGFTPKSGEYFGRGEATRLPEPYGKPAFLAQEASRFIRQNRERPFVLFVNFLEPHMPFFGPRDGQYPPASVDLPPNFESPPTADNHLKSRALQRRYQEKGFGMPLETGEDWRKLISNYWGLCSLVDTHVGTILGTLEECGLYDDTIIVYTSDHGDMMGSHRLLAKCVMYEEATRVPLLVKLPGQKTSERIAPPVSQVDLVPTLLDLMGEPVPTESTELEGSSLLTGPGDFGSGPQRDLFIEWNGPNSGAKELSSDDPLPEWLRELGTREELSEAITDSIRTVVTPDGWKYNCSPRGDHELFNLTRDPYETINLAGRADLAPLRQDLTTRIRKWQEYTGDRVELPDAE